MLSLSDSSFAPAFMTDHHRHFSAINPLEQSQLDAFFNAGGLTIYATTASPWRWLVCAQHRALEATVVDPHSFFEKEAAALLTPPAPEKIKKKKKTFEQSRLIQWLTRAAQQTTQPAVAPGAKPMPTAANNPDKKAFSALIGMHESDWDSVGLPPPITAHEIQHFWQAHNAALSDIESAFLPSKIDLPPELALFTIRHLAQARRDVEATLFIAQSTQSLRLPRLMADALAIRGFEGATQNPLRFEGNDYASTALDDTAAYIDAAAALAMQRLVLPIDHADHLLRMNVMAISQMAASLVEQHAPAPFAFLLKAKEIFIARCDICRFPPTTRFATAVAEGDLDGDSPWVRRIAAAYHRLFDGRAQTAPEDTSLNPSNVIRFMA